MRDDSRAPTPYQIAENAIYAAYRAEKWAAQIAYEAACRPTYERYNEATGADFLPAYHAFHAVKAVEEVKWDAAVAAAWARCEVALRENVLRFADSLGA